MSETTITEDTHGRRSPLRAPASPALVVAYCRDEPWRVGEALLVPPHGARSARGGREGPRFVFGRGAAEPGDPHPRLVLVAQRPGAIEPKPPLASKRVSRVQLVLEPTARGLLVRGVGRCELSRNGASLDGREDGEELVQGDVLAIGRQLVFLCVARPATLDGPAPTHAFGRADADGFVGESPAAWALRAELAFVAPRGAHALVLGATGTGKELVARALHARSPRRSRELVARNASTLPEGLADAELFGSVRGYPHATSPERAGLVGRAEGSTLFLDEIGDLPAELQPHLLRLLDDGEYHRLGEAAARRADVRVIGATNRPLATLREDLAARFPIRVAIPGLAERREDVPLLLRHMVERIARDEPEVGRSCLDDRGSLLVDPTWLTTVLRSPLTANARDLTRLVWDALPREGAAVLGEGMAHASASATPGAQAAADDPPAAELQRALDEHNGSIERTWRALGLANRYVLRRLVRKHGLVVARRASP